MFTKISILMEYANFIENKYVKEDMALSQLACLMTELCGLHITIGNLYYYINNELGLSKSVQEGCYKRRKISDKELVQYTVEGLNAPTIAQKVGMSRVGVWARLNCLNKGGK